MPLQELQKEEEEAKKRKRKLDKTTERRERYREEKEDYKSYSQESIATEISGLVLCVSRDISRMNFLLQFWNVGFAVSGCPDAPSHENDDLHEERYL